MGIELKNIDRDITVRWIPVTRALPKCGEVVLVCSIDHRRNKVSNYNNEYRGSVRIDKLMSYDGVDFFWSKGNAPSVVAWMPIPTLPVILKSK